MEQKASIVAEVPEEMVRLVMSQFGMEVSPRCARLFSDPFDKIT